jgi:hypothetical protein
MKSGNPLGYMTGLVPDHLDLQLWIFLRNLAAVNHLILK